MPHYRPARALTGKALRARAFTMLELAIASALFLLAAGILSLAVASSIGNRAEASARSSVEALLAQNADSVAKGSYNQLLTNTFTPPVPCTAATGLGTATQSCLVVGNKTYQASWAITAGSDPLGQSKINATSLSLTGSVTFPSGAVVTVTRIINAPSYAYAPNQGVVRVQVTSSTGLWNGTDPVYLLQQASPSTIVASASVSSGVAVLRGNYSSCTSTSPCVLGLRPGNNFASNGTGVTELPSQAWGRGSQIVLTSGGLTEGNMTLAGTGTAKLTLQATNTNTTQTSTNPIPGSVCLYLNFNDGVADQSVPVCNFSAAESISISDYAPDTSSPAVRVPLPVGVPMTFSTDSSSATCPYVSNPSGTVPLHQQGYTALGPPSLAANWVDSAVCTSWTWGNPTTATISGSTTSWASASLTLTAGSAVTGTVTWSGWGLAGNLFVADTGNNAIRTISPAGVVSTFATSANSISFNAPTGVDVDTSGNVYVSDTGNNRIVKLSPTGAYLWSAGVNAPGKITLDSDSSYLYTYGASTNLLYQINTSSGGLVWTTIALPCPCSITYANSALFLGTTSASKAYIEKITGMQPSSLTSITGTVVAGTTSTGSTNAQGTSALFNLPQSLAADSSGNLYVADNNNHEIRKVDPAYNVTTLSGQVGSYGFIDGPASVAKFKSPTGVTLDSSGSSLYVADTGNNAIRKVSTVGTTSTFAGSTAGTAGSTNGSGTAALFSGPTDVASGPGWASAQPAIGFGAVPVWSAPRIASSCASGSGSCSSIGTTVPENTDCPSSQCYSSPAPRLVSPMTSGQYTQAVTATAGAFTCFNLSVADDSNTTISAAITNTTSGGTLTKAPASGCAAAGASVASLPTIPAGGGNIALAWQQASSSPATLTWFTLTLTNGTGYSSTYTVGLYATGSQIFSIIGTTATVAQGASTTLTASLVNADGTSPSTGTLPNSATVTFACVGYCPAGITQTASTTTNTSGVVSVTASAAASSTAPAGTYQYTVTATNGRTGTAYLVVSSVLGSVSVSLSPTSSAQGTVSTATVTARDKASSLMSGVVAGISVTTSGGAAAVGVYPGTASGSTGTGSAGGCATVSGTCTVSVIVESAAPAGSYTVTASSSTYTSTAALTVTSAPGSVSASAPTIGQNSTTSVSTKVLDGAGVALTGSTVTFSGLPTGTTIPTTGATNSSGVSTATVTTTTTPSGSYTVTATVTGTSVTTTFTLTVTATPSTVTAVSSPSTCEGCRGTAVVLVKDASGNPVVNQSVTFVTDTSTYSGDAQYLTETSQSVTNSAGQASSSYDVAANTPKRTVKITATAGAVSGKVSITVTAGVAAIALSGSVQQNTGTVLLPATTALSLTVYDGTGAAYPGVTVNSITGVAGVGISLSGSHVTDASGVVPVTVSQVAALTAGLQLFTLVLTDPNSSAAVSFPGYFAVLPTVGTITASPTSVAVKRLGQTTAQVTMLDLNGSPAVGVTPTLSGNTGYTAAANSSGVAVVYLYGPSSAGTTTATVTINGKSASISVVTS